MSMPLTVLAFLTTMTIQTILRAEELHRAALLFVAGAWGKTCIKKKKHRHCRHSILPSTNAVDQAPRLLPRPILANAALLIPASEGLLLQLLTQGADLAGNSPGVAPVRAQSRLETPTVRRCHNRRVEEPGQIVLSEIPSSRKSSSILHQLYQVSTLKVAVVTQWTVHLILF